MGRNRPPNPGTLEEKPLEDPTPRANGTTACAAVRVELLCASAAKKKIEKKN